ncbi:LAME_0A05512g1_1 [Lachancea meyersii CBS 8951]|uniref:DNA 3'-5' helicase n=1 Tax=Lachancea meyersii CBS 8951 TaxID=1266667 RepID=A0A1G4IPY0_9SACH|nr:LAME_0A05512g1_1 [Lachancea meyersii CBS 8951]
MSHFLSSLNEKQHECVVFDHGNALQIVAGPGTGKTKVLTTRVAYLLLEKGLNPSDVVITTFTKKATLEMIERIGVLLEGTGINPKSLWIGTFHSICARVLRQHGWRIGLPKDWRTFSDSDTDPIYAKLVEKMPDQVRDYAHSYNRRVNLLRPNSSRDWAVHPAAVKKMVSWLKSEGVTADEYRARNDHDPALLHFYDQYQAELISQHALDFDDLLLHAFKLLAKQRCLPNIKHVLVDEFQDTNSIQLNLMYLFARGCGSRSQGITAVGDPDQSIYGFRNALAGNFEDMITHCPIPCSRIVLVENYRSSQRILTTSEMLIKQQLTGREDRLPLRAQFDSDFPPVYIEFPAKFLESRALAREIIYLRSLPNLWNYNDFALLVRHRRQIRPLETSLIEHRIPYKIVNGRAFWELKEINGMMDLLKCVYSDYEKNAILRALQYPARGLGSATAKKLENVVGDYDTPFSALQAIVNDSRKYDLPAKAISVIQGFLSLITSCRERLIGAVDCKVISTIFDELYEVSGLQYEYLYVDGKKKADVNPKGEPNFANKRHLNIQLLREHVANFKPMDEDLAQRDGLTDEDAKVAKEINIHDILREFIDSVNLFSTETEVDESQMSEKQIRQKKKREEEGFVTISTIHGAKGLEWPVVMIPGCVEGVIPCVFGNKEDADESENDSDSEENKTNGGGNSPKKMRPKNNEGSLDEERRMFFVAQTRAKFLLYLTATSSNDSESKYDISKPSRFLTTDLVSTMCQEQKVFDSLDSVRKLYSAVDKPMPSDKPSFSLDTLIKDYASFINYRRERMIWRGTTVVDTVRLKFDENTNQPPASYGIITAASYLKNSSTNHPSSSRATYQASAYKNQVATRTTSDPSALAGKKNAPPHSLSRSYSNGSASFKSYAPKTSPRKPTKSLQPSSFAPKAEESAAQLERNRTKSNNSLTNTVKNVSESLKKPGFPSATHRAGRQSRRKIVADSIDLGEIPCSNEVSTTQSDESVVTKEEPDKDSLSRKSIGALKHDLKVKNEMDSAVNSGTGQQASSSQAPLTKRANSPEGIGRKRVKIEPLNGGPDIMSRLSKAKKRAAESKDTVIIID